MVAVSKAVVGHPSAGINELGMPFLVNRANLSVPAFAGKLGEDEWADSP
jgi:hypothetical protein